MNVYPRQKISSKEKTEVREGERVSDFLKNTTDYYISQSAANVGEYDEMVSLYQAAAGILDSTAYKYVLNPYNTNNEDYLRYPASIRNYSIIKPIVKLFVGENAKRPSNHEVVVLNSDSQNKFTETLNERVYDVLKQQFVNELNQLGVETGMESKKVPTIAEVVADHKANYLDNRAIKGQEALDYIRYGCDLDDKYQDAFYNWIVSGRVYSYKEVYRDDVHFQVVSPLEMWSTRDGGTPFVEDDTAAVRRFRLSANAVIDRFRDKLEDKDIEFLDGLKNGSNVSQTLTPGVTIVNNANLDGVLNNTPKNTLLSNGLVDVYHVTWKTFKKVGILSYYNEVGIIEEKEVDDTYVMDKTLGDVSIDWQWISEFWESWRIDTEIYLSGGALPVQRDELNNSSICKGCYNGRINDDVLGNINSPVKDGLPYEVLHNIYHYRLERILAKNKDKVMLLPMGMIPKKWDMDKFMYQVDATGIAWFDETKPNAMMALNAIKTLDASLANYAKDMIFFINSIKNEYWESLGVNSQRYGDVSASEGKGNVEQAIFRSAIITSEEFRKFDKFREKDHDGLLDYSKVAWVNGKKGMYINSDGRKALLDIDGEAHMETEYGVFCKNNSIEQDKLNSMKQLAHAAVQKTGKLGMSAEVIDSNNFAKVKDIIKRGEEIEQALIEAAAAKQQESDQKIAAMNNEAAKVKAESDKYKVDMDYKKAIDVATIQAHITNMSLDPDNTDAENEMGQQELNIKHNDSIASREIEHKKLENDRLKMSTENFNKMEDRKMQEKEIASREKVANLKKKSTK